MVFNVLQRSKLLLASLALSLLGFNSYSQTVFGIVENSSDHTILEEALINDGLDVILDYSFENYTLFAPDDSAFTAAFGALPGVNNVSDFSALLNSEAILKYHVLGFTTLSGGISNGQIETPLNTTNTVKFTDDGGTLYINQSEIDGPDLGASNGVVHSMDQVILPNETVADVAIATGDHDSLVAALVEARLLPTVTDPFNDYTVVAPDDNAFSSALDSLGLSDVVSIPNLSDVLLYHVFGSSVPSSSLTNGQLAAPVNTANTIKVTLDAGDVFLNQAEVTNADVNADNGLVHVTDQVILSNETVADVAIGTGVHDSLVAALIEARLLPTVTDPFNDYTVVAPDDNAFSSALDSLGLSNVASIPNLSDVLLYHVFGSSVASSSLTNGQLAAPVNTANTIKVTLDAGDVFLNQAEVTNADVNADNGLVHVTDQVILPNETVADVAIGTGVHDSLVAALIEARLLPTVTDPFNDYTVVAPDDNAFSSALDSLGLSDVVSIPNLSDVLLYHVFGSSVPSSSLTNGQLAAPVNSANTIKVTLDSGDVFLNQAEVTNADVNADNGLVHVTDQVILPNETVADVVIKASNKTTLDTAIVEAKLLPALTDPFAELTLFAPTDDAFNDFFADESISASDLLSDANLENILLYHAVGSELGQTDLTNGQLAMLDGNETTIDANASPETINGTDITSFNTGNPTNGKVHDINYVLMNTITSIRDEIGFESISVYPNPARNVLNITDLNNASFQVINVSGAVVKSGFISNQNVDVSQLQKGTYIIKIQDGNTILTSRFVKM